MKQIIQNIKSFFAKGWKRPAQEVPAEKQTDKKPKKTVKDWLPKALLVIFAATFCFSGFQIIKNSIQADKRDELYTDLSGMAVKPVDPAPVTPPSNDMEETTESTEETQQQETTTQWELQIPTSSPIAVDFELLQEKNADVMAWVYCPDTPVNYPVVRGADNDYYLHRLLDGTVNKAGTIFVDCRNSVDFTDPHTIIYGHNMRDLSMFGSLYKYAKQDYYEKHPVWYINTPEKNYVVVLLAGHITDPRAELYAFKGTPEEPMEILQNAMGRSAFRTGATLEENDRLVTFSTCYGSSSRFVLIGALREIS